LNKRRSKSKEKNYLDMICRSTSLEERCKKTSQRPGNLIDQGAGDRCMGYLNLAPKGKQNPPFNAVDSQKQKQTAGNKLPQPDHDLLYLETGKEGSWVPQLKNSTVLIRLELSRPILALIRFN
jgi:hypothetical protein